MSAENPLYVPRNWLAQEAIAATAGDWAPLEALMKLLRAPYVEAPEAAHYAEKRPEWARHEPGCAMLSCVTGAARARAPSPPGDRAARTLTAGRFPSARGRPPKPRTIAA